MPLILALLALLLAAAPAAAQQPLSQAWPWDTETWRDAQKYAEKGAAELMQSLTVLLRAMPYGLPRVDAQGNIIIPRQHPPALDRHQRDRT
jgi:hypothetical protein